MVMPVECPAFFMERGMENILQTVINTTLNVIKFFEEKTKSAKIIRGIKRSIQFDEVFLWCSLYLYDIKILQQENVY